MSGAGEIRYDDDCLVITIDIVDCPMAEIPLTDVFDVPTMTLCETYHDEIRKSVLQQLQDTTWLSEDLLPSLVDPGFGMYHAHDRNSISLLRKPALQRLIKQRLQGCSQLSDLVHVPILIRFLIPDADIPKPLPTITSFSLPTALSAAPTSTSLMWVTMPIAPSASVSCIIISHAAILKQLGTDGYHMLSFTEGVGHIHFPHRLRRSKDIYIILQPTASRGSLTFTEALIAPTAEAHLAPLPSDQVVRKLCTEHALVTAETILNPIDGMTCNACHNT